MRRIAWLVFGLTLSNAWARNDGVPELLQFVESAQLPAVGLTAGQKKNAAFEQDLNKARTLEKQLQRLKSENLLLERENTLLRQQPIVNQQNTAVAEMQTPKPLPPLPELSQIVKNVRQAFALTPEEAKLQQRLALQKQAMEKTQADKTALESEAFWLQTKSDLNSEMTKELYALGISMGENIRAIQNERKTWGLETDQNTLVKGLLDTLTNKSQLTPEQYQLALRNTEKRIDEARVKVAANQQQAGQKALQAFKAKAGVKKDPTGFWYHIGYAGDEEIKAGAKIAIVVTEKLTNGTVVQDMESNGKMLSQTLESYPPLFRRAISLLKTTAP
ncbi:hypothetical protein CIG19_00825 [Enterobacterales bacterium CwR94]|nr:hypothetical protein CIG19_00825 [Enterobacterales bacterium CwR94]